MEKIELLIAYCKKNGGSITFPQPMRLRLPYEDSAGEPNLIELKVIGDELWLVDMWRNYDEPKTRLLSGLYWPFVDAVCDFSLRWLRDNKPLDTNLF